MAAKPNEMEMVRIPLPDYVELIAQLKELKKRVDKIAPFDSDEYDFLQQYHQVINKVATALKGLEGDQNTFGVYLPTLIGLRHVLTEYSNPEFATETQQCVPLAKALRDGFERRFGSLMNVCDPTSAPLYIAMMTNPEYKLNYMGTAHIDPRILYKLKDMLVNAAIEIQITNDEADAELNRDNC